MAAGNGNIYRKNDIVNGRIRIDSPCGEGGTGEVYRCTHLATTEECALKVLYPHLAKARVPLALFALEQRIHARIRRNPHIVHVFEAGLDVQRGLQYLVMEHITGPTLEEHLKTYKRPIPPDLALVLLGQLADGLGQAHAADVVHRDLKPSNLFITLTYQSEPVLKVSDFGVAKVLDGPRASDVTPAGTPAYSAPEQQLYALPEGQTIGSSITFATDIWAYGLIALEMLTLIHPNEIWFAEAAKRTPTTREGQTTVPTQSTISEVCARSDCLPLGFDGWLRRCLELSPANRFQRVNEAFDALKQLFLEDERFCELVPEDAPYRIRIIVSQPGDKEVWRGRRNQRRTHQNWDGSDTTSLTSNALPNHHRAVPSNSSRQSLVKRPAFVACTGVTMVGLAALVTRLPLQTQMRKVDSETTFPANIASWNPLQTAVGSTYRAPTGIEDEELFSLEPNAEINVEMPSNCHFRIGAYEVPFAPPFTHLRFHAQPNISVSINCTDESKSLGRCWLNVTTGQQKTLTIHDPKSQFHPFEPTQDCSQWYK